MIRTHKIILTAVVAALTLPALAQQPDLQQKLEAVKAAAAANNQALHQYTWTETTQLTLKGDPKPPTKKLCQYGPDGTIQKTPIGAPAPPPQGGRLKQRMVARKKPKCRTTCRT